MHRVVSTLLALMSLVASAADNVLTIGSVLELNDAHLVLYSGSPPLQPCAELRIRALHRDYQRKAFFSIGVLPVQIAEGVSCQIENPAAVSNALAQCHRALFGSGTRHLELEQLELLVGGESTNRLTCARARPGLGGQWELFQGVCLQSGTNCIQANSAVLQINGPGTGRLLMQTLPPVLFDLCAGRLAQAPEPKDRN